MGFFTTLVVFIILTVLSELLRPRPNLENAKPADLGDFNFPTTTEGRGVPLVWGTVKIEGPNVIWYGDLEQDAITEKVQTGLFSTEKVVIGYHYSVGIQFALCRGELTELTRVWNGDSLVFDGNVTHNSTFTIDEPDLYGGDELGNGGLQGTFRFYAGTTGQPASSYLDDFQQEGGDTPAYRGTAYIAPDDDPIYIGNSTQIKTWSFEVRRLPTGPASGGDEGVGANDQEANPVNVIYEILTDTDWGLAIDPADIDTSSFADAGSTLADEINGFSMLLDRPIEAVELIRLVEEQIDGVVFQNAQTGLWQINLARADYDIDTVPEMDESNIVEMKSFSRGSWEDTANNIRTPFTRRGSQSNYVTTMGLAQDMANIRIQNGSNVTATIRYPGVKRGRTANDLAWRELRGLSTPLAKATVVVDRTFWDVQPAQVLALSYELLGFTKLPMRVQSIDLNELTENRITLDLVQDTYKFQAGSFADPGDTGWEEPLDTLTPFPADQQIAFEAPRKMVFLGSQIEDNKIWVGARKSGSEVSLNIRARTAVNPAPPAGAYSDSGDAYAFFLMGELKSDLAVGSVVPDPSFLITTTPDTQDLLNGSFDPASTADMGQDLVNLILIGNEFMTVTSSQTSGADVQLNDVYRGFMDSAQQFHAAGTPVYVIHLGGALTLSQFNNNDNVELVLLPTSATDQVDEGSATPILIEPMVDRTLRPYPPSRVTIDNIEWGTTTSLEADGTVDEDFSFDVELFRRDFRISTLNEITGLQTEAETAFPDFPTANNTRQVVDIYDDPDGANTFLFSTTFSVQTTAMLRIDILKATDGILPTRLGVVCSSLHDFEGATDLASVNDLSFQFDVTSALTGQFEFGALDTNDLSNLYAATVAGTYNFTLSSSFTVGDVEYRINGGAWQTLITAGGTVGSIAGVVISDTIEVQHLSSDVAVTKQLDMTAAGVGQDGFAILFT